MKRAAVGVLVIATAAVIVYRMTRKTDQSASVKNEYQEFIDDMFGAIYPEELRVNSQPYNQFDDKSIPLGIRNNNPGNIELGDDWQGMRVPQTHPRFIQFIEPEYGIRAMTRIIDNYKKRGIKTIAQIINTWAPPVENNTESYINSVTKKTGWPSFYIPEKARGDYLPLIQAIIHHENGRQPYADATIVKGIGMA